MSAAEPLALASTDPAFQFTIDHQWAQLPTELAWGITHGVAIDSEGLVYVLQTGRDGHADDCVQVFAPDGTWVRSWGSQFAGTGHGLEIVTLNGAEVALITDQGRGLFCCSLTGAVLWKLGKPSFYKKRPNLNWSPSNCCVDDQGRVHLSDGYGTYFVTVLDAEGKELGMYGGPGLGEQHLLAPHGLGLVHGFGERAVIMMAENKEACLHVLDAEGSHIARITDTELVAPRHVVPWGDDTLLVPDLVGRLSVWTTAGTYIATIGQSPYDFIGMFDHRGDLPEDQPQGAFLAPHDVAVGLDGALYVTEWLDHGRVSKLTPA